MSTAGVFSGREIAQMAIQMEQSGYGFYSAAAEAASHPEVRKLLEWLSGQERLHERIFRDMLPTIPEHRPPEEYDGQRAEFIQFLLDTRVLPDIASGERALARMSSDDEVLDYALGFEKDTILFLYEMRDLVPSGQAAQVDRLLTEEKGHVQRLSAMKHEAC
ncbi:ferritin family protein [bacterium]|nr:ferritin family protein [bacterium]